MKIMLIGSSGAGKSTFSRQLSELTGFPVLHLDRVWHNTDYSLEATEYFRLVQKEFIENNMDCIIDGNYSATMDIRLENADMIVWLKINRVKAIGRVIRRSLKSRLVGHNRSDMSTNFVERFDKEYWKFMKFIWNFPKVNELRIQAMINDFDKNDQVIIVKNHNDKDKVISLLK
ncbi:hypothetical protein [Lactovum miscens]|uniref:Adenylate kinase family enzyme n=1 Tax=Lactovum miscens TaxID=190387 RepID=A0A841C7N9_9LACT|nr:hypothetical protein [Lactovum miscens]MBB5888364.1 adenylate kinase family enzyme [Lactovum miscens]